MPGGKLSRVFDPYFRSPRARADGSGIGLSVVAALVHAHGGTAETANSRDGGPSSWSLFVWPARTPGVPAAGRPTARGELTAVRRDDAVERGRSHGRNRAGATWEPLSAPAGTTSVTFPADGETMHTAALDGEAAAVSASTDGGRTWNEL